jgi:Geranylgeranyl pyrophosphate synthase
MIADTLAYLESRRAPILEALHRLPSPPGGRAADSLERIAEFCSRGKMLRGCLVFLGWDTARAELTAQAELARVDAERVAAVAAAMELFQAGLLAHDDIMDRDLTRRGAPTIHAAYAAEARASGARDGEHLGEALGICLGDLCYFEAYALIGRGAIVGLCSEVLAEVAVAQMSDVAWGATGEEPSEEDILAMYRGKTARYSFSLPLAAGALVAGEAGLGDRLAGLGDRLGILFQMRDDELGLFGDPAVTGKAVGSDLREGKKTLFRSRLLAAAGEREAVRLGPLFRGEVEPAAADLDYIRALADELGVTSSLAAMSEAAESEARDIIRALPRLTPETQAVLEGLVEYVTKRVK